ncbi:MAG: PAS domain S-box protein [Desulfobacterales bacterium]|nr:PAS domain S-box protein [Desulfobacterales bacterium]
MFQFLQKIRRRLVFKLVLTVGVVLVFSISTWAFFNIRYQKQKMMKNIVAGMDQLTSTIRLGTRYAMMLNSRDDINQIINNIARQPEIENLRIYNKDGQIKFSNRPSEMDKITNIKAEACDICHRSDPPRAQVSLEERIRIFRSPAGYRLLGIISPIGNDPGCATGGCHVHPEDKQILGALDVVISLQKFDAEIGGVERGITGFAVFVFLTTSAFIFVFVLHFVNRPIKKLISGTVRIGKGEYGTVVDVGQEDEMGQLATAINEMGDQIAEKQAELKKQRDEYQNLFDLVPCLITVQDRDYNLLRYNREFSQRFDPKPGVHCFRAYKGRDEKCVNCPVEKTFEDGFPHYTEEHGIDKEGIATHWAVQTSPVRDKSGKIVAAMEVSLDITRHKQLEMKLASSEKKYHAIFNNIPNPVFVLEPDTLNILDCNDSVTAVYGYGQEELQGRCFLDLFVKGDRSQQARLLKTASEITQIRQVESSGKILFVNIRISPSEYSERKVLLVTTSDITKRLEAEQQLIQASKMATLGEMATGVAHELNQPLSVIKTASSFFVKKIDQDKPLEPSLLSSMLKKIDSNVDRATRIINHMRQFARKSEVNLVKVHINEVIEKAFEIFSQQLKVRGIEVAWHLAETLPKIWVDPSRLEQVFINLLLNARDAIEEKTAVGDYGSMAGTITIATSLRADRVVAEVADTGPGIPGHVLEKIFEPFFTTKEVGKGTGLGLSISYGIVKDCGGDIRAESSPDGGARFVLEFPVTQGATGPVGR